jgi:hypothetical protein
VLCVCAIISSFLLPGAHPFAGATGKVNMMKIMRGDRNDLSGREYSDGLKALIYRMMDVVGKCHIFVFDGVCCTCHVSRRHG